MASNTKTHRTASRLRATRGGAPLRRSAALDRVAPTRGRRLAAGEAALRLAAEQAPADITRGIRQVRRCALDEVLLAAASLEIRDDFRDLPAKPVALLSGHGSSFATNPCVPSTHSLGTALCGPCSNARSCLLPMPLRDAPRGTRPTANRPGCCASRARCA